MNVNKFWSSSEKYSNKRTPVFQTCLFGTAETNLRKETCKKDTGDEQGKQILIYLLAI